PAPVERIVDGGAPIAVLEGVKSFLLDYTVWSETGDGEPPVIESGEMELYRIDASNTVGPSDLDVQDAKLKAQRFIPMVPLDVRSYSITRIGFVGKPDGSPTETMRIAIHQTVNGLPEASAVASTLFPEVALIEDEWSYVSFPGGLYFDIKNEIAIVFTSLIGGHAAKIERGDTLSEIGALLEGETGKAWSIDATRGIWLRVYGTMIRPDPNWTPPDDIHLQAVRIDIDPTTDGSGLVSTSTMLLNEPDVSAGVISH
ncbi:MAG: hypothetical protein ACF8QF_11745, partial [Phycisphaerales bacterium]